MLQFTYVFDRTLSYGINQHDSVDTVPEGFVEDAVNVDIEASTLQLRKGFERVGGDIPLRIESVAIVSTGATGDVGTFFLPDYVDLTNVTPGPIVIAGRINAVSSFYWGNVASGVRYATYTIGDRVTLLAAGTTVSLLPAETTIASTYDLIHLYDISSHEMVKTTSITLDSGTLGLDITYSVAADRDVSIATFTPETGEYYEAVVPAGGLSTISVAAGVHALPNLDIIPMLYEVSGADYISFEADSFVIDSASGDVAFNFSEVIATDSYVSLIAAANTVTGTTMGTATSTTVTIENAESKFLMAACYEENISANTLSLIWPDSIVYDPVTNSHDVTFVHGSESINYKICYVYGETTANRIIVSDIGAAMSGVFGTVSFSAATMCVYGIPQDDLVIKTKINHIDNYLTDNETVVAADGFIYRSSTDLGFTESFDGRDRVVATTILGPAFATVTPSVSLARTNGYVVSSSVNSGGYARVKSYRYLAGRGVEYVLDMPGHNASPSWNVAVDIAHDLLTVTGCMNSRFNGTFVIAEAIDTSDPDEAVFIVTNDAVDKSIWDTNEAGCLAGVFTGSLTFATGFSVEADDSIVIDSDAVFTVSEDTSGVTIYLKDLFSTYRVNAGLRVGVTVTKTVHDLAASYLVAGDCVTVGGKTNHIKQVTSTQVTFRDATEISNGQMDVIVPFRWQLIYPDDERLGDDLVDRTAFQKSISSKDSLYFANGIKYDGDRIYKSGIPPMQCHLFIQVEESSNGIAVPFTATDSSTAGGVAAVTVTDASGFEVGDRLLLKNNNAGAVTIDPKTVYTVTDIDTTAGTISTNPFLPATAVAGTDYVCKFYEYEYFTRITIIDRNGNLIVGPSTGSGDFRVRLTAPSKVYIRGKVFAPGFENVDYERLQIEIFRRNKTLAEANSFYANFFKVGSVDATNETYIDFTDVVSDEVLTTGDLDPIIDPSGGIGERRARALSAETITSVNNQIVLSNLEGENSVEIQMFGTTITEANISGKEFIVTYTLGALTWPVTFKVEDTAPTDVTAASVAGTVFTLTTSITWAGRANLGAGDYIYVANKTPNSGNGRVTFLGWWQLTSITESAGHFVDMNVTWSGTPAALDPADYANLTVYYDDSGIIPLADLIAHYNIGQSISSTGTVLEMFPYHLASAISAVLGSYGIYARGGRDYQKGYIRIFGDSLISVELPATLPTGMVVFGNGEKLAGGDTVTARRKTYPARCILSMPGYPEVFQDVEADTSKLLPAMIDVNPDEGDTIEVAVPFFASSSFGAAQQSAILSIFKPHSIYVLDARALYNGESTVIQRLATRGLGCTAPLSVTNSDEGLFFANESGVYFLDRSFTVSFASNNIERLSFDSVSELAASNVVRDRKYLLCGPYESTDGDNNGAFVYKYGDPAAEGQRGGWTRYSGIYATGFATKVDDTFFASNRGYVGQLLFANESESYHDAGSAIDLEIVFRATDFGLPSVRKVVKFLTLFFETSYDTVEGEIDVYAANDMSNNFVYLDTCVVKGRDAQSLNNIGDPIRDKIQQVAFSPDRAHLTHMQVKASVSLYKNFFRISRLVYNVAALRTRGGAQSEQTKD